MNLPDIKELGKVIDLCRKKGVSVFQLGELRLELGEEPERRARPSTVGNDEAAPDAADPWANFPAGELTSEQLAFYSAGGAPGEEPWNQKESEA